MLRYYTYYSIGGYKNLFLGSDENEEDRLYYLPLLSVLKDEAKDDIESKSTFDELNSLPKIYQLSDKNAYDFPSAATPLFSHSGYKIIYRHVSGKFHALALRDITCGSKDELGRNIPFLMIITGDTKEDVKKLDKLAAYFASYLKDTERDIASFIGYDMDKNGLCFQLAGFNSWIGTITKNDNSNAVVTNDEVIRVTGAPGKVALLCIPPGISESYASTEQNINGYTIISTSMDEIICKNDVEQIVNKLEAVTAERDKAKEECARMKKVAIGAGVGGFALGLILKSCS